MLHNPDVARALYEFKTFTLHAEFHTLHGDIVPWHWLVLVLCISPKPSLYMESSMALASPGVSLANNVPDAPTLIVSENTSMKISPFFG